MRPMAGRNAVALQRSQQPPMQPKPVPAPIAGLVTSQNIGAMEPGTAIVLDNFMPTRTGIRVRGGNVLYATLGTAPVESLISYIGLTRQLFGASNGSVYPITSVADPAIPPAASFSGQTSDYYSSLNFATTGGNFLYAVNGTDLARLYNGTTWTAINGASVPAITGIATSTFSQVNSYRNRLYFVESGSLNLWYLPVDSIGGAAAVLSLSGIFQKGGSILFSATWSSESGSASMQSYLIVMSTEGECAVFQGSFPGGTDWSLVNVYDISKPLGKNGWFKAGGDIIIATEQGLVPVSAARMKDPAALGLDAISRNIEPDWKAAAQQRRAVPWEIAKWDEQDAFFVNAPLVTADQAKIAFVGNLKTGALTRYTNLDQRCYAIHNGQLYYGSNDGTVNQAEIGGSDQGMPYTASVAFAWDHLGVPGYDKSMKQAQADFLTGGPFSYRLSASVDFNQRFPVPPNTTADPTNSSLFDTSLWDQALWDQGLTQYHLTTRQMSIGQSGRVFSLQLQVPINQIETPSIELVAVNVTYTSGGYAR